MAFYYNELGPIPTTILIIVAVALFLPKFLRRNFETDKMKDIGGAYHQEKIGSFLLTRADKTGFYPYREFNSIFAFISPIKYSRKQHKSKIYYIDLKTKCLILLIHAVLFLGFILAFLKVSKIENNLLSIVLILVSTIVFFQFFDTVRNFIIKKFAKKFSTSDRNNK